jgi:predicted Zn finger-like uncharacterized protein
MIAACPKCTARYRVDESRIGPEGAKLKCSRCEGQFRVLTPAAARAQARAKAQAQTLQKTSESSAVAPRIASPKPSSLAAMQHNEVRLSPPTQKEASAPDGIDKSKVDRDRLVVVADSDVEAGKATINQLSAWGLTPILVHDGVEAMLTIQRLLPSVVVLDAGLPKMHGFQVCEVIKRNESLRHTGVILVGAIHNRDRYRRQSTELYGADHYVGQADLPDGLGPLLKRMGLELSGATQAPTPTQEPKMPPPPAAPRPVFFELPSMPPPTPQSPPPTPDPVSSPASIEAESEPPQPEFSVAPASMPDLDPALAEERSNAERLARIIVSDIALYQADKFAEAIRVGNPVEALGVEIREGRSLFAQRVSETMRNERDFIADELIRVARKRGMQ